MTGFFYELGRYFSYLWAGLTHALALDPKVFQFVETYPRSAWVVAGIVFLAGVSTLLGHSAVLFINRVRRNRFIISLIVNGLVYIISYVVWGLVVWLAGRVLFMDDEETIRRMAEALLVRLGFEVVTVSDGAEAVSTYAEAMANGRPFRVVVMDLTVPGGMGGRQAMEELLKIDADVKAIVSSGYSSDPVLANHRAHGFCGVVAKPYRIADLARVMKTVLEQEKVA